MWVPGPACTAHGTAIMYSRECLAEPVPMQTPAVSPQPCTLMDLAVWSHLCLAQVVLALSLPVSQCP